MDFLQYGTAKQVAPMRMFPKVAPVTAIHCSELNPILHRLGGTGRGDKPVPRGNLFGPEHVLNLLELHGVIRLSLFLKTTARRADGTAVAFLS